jgi:hypothetical protein
MLMLFDCTDPNLTKIIALIKAFLQLVQILIPIALIVLGSLDLGKAVMSSNEDAIKKAQGMLIKRVIAAVLVFLVATIVNFVMTFVGNTDWKACWSADANITNDTNITFIGA